MEGLWVSQSRNATVNVEVALAGVGRELEKRSGQVCVKLSGCV
jgi:hypothetical protein